MIFLFHNIFLDPFCYISFFTEILLFVFIFIFRGYSTTALDVDPRIAFSLASRFPTNTHLKAEITQLVQVCLTFIEYLHYNGKEMKHVNYCVTINCLAGNVMVATVIVVIRLSISETSIDLFSDLLLLLL